MKELRSIGIAPDLLLCRANRPIPEAERKKIAQFCNVREDNVIAATDVETIYEVPLSYHAHGFDTQVMRYFGITDAPGTRPLRLGEDRQAHAHAGGRGGDRGGRQVHRSARRLQVAVRSAHSMAGVANSVRVDTRWIEADDLEVNGTAGALESVHGVLVPGGFGERGVPGKIAAVEYARTARRPLLRHLLRHAARGNRDCAQRRRDCRRRFHRVRALRRSCDRADDRVGPGRRVWSAATPATTWAAPWRLGAYEAVLEQGQAGCGRSTAGSGSSSVTATVTK